MPKIKKEAVSVSFHYLIRQEEGQGGEFEWIGFGEEEFNTLADTLCNLAPLDLNDEKVQDAVRLKKIVPLEDVERVNPRTLFGVYRAVHWGHAFDNTVVGKVPAESLNLRKFYFVLYLGKDGKIYLGVQYLGLYGGYEGLKNTIVRHLFNNKNVVPHSFRHDSLMFEDVDPSELHVTVARQSEEIEGLTTIGSEAIVTFKKAGRKDSEFGEQVKKRLFPVMGTDLDKVRKAASEIVNDSGLMAVSDKDIADCTVVGRVNGQRKKVYMISEGLHATKFPLDTTYDDDGIPKSEPTRAKMLQVLEAKIISVLADA